MKQIEWSDLDPQIQEELNMASESAKKQYPPTSDNHIGAVLVSGEIKIAAAGIKRRRFNSGTCAERMAIDQAIYQGLTHIDRIVLIGFHDLNHYEQVVSPCGSCRQIIHETMVNMKQDDLTLILSNSAKTKIILTSIKELLPLVYENANVAETIK